MPQGQPSEVVKQLARAWLGAPSGLASATDLVTLLQQIAERARELTEADYAAISTFDESGTMERFIYAGMPEHQARTIGNPPVGRGLLGTLAHTDAPILANDVRSHVAFTGWPDGHPDMTHFLGIPIRADGRTIGSLYMTRGRDRPPFTEDDEVAGCMLALQVALSVSAALAQQRRGRVSLLEERVRIAHDLHDGTIQSLYALGLEIDAHRHREDVAENTRSLLGEAVTRINLLIGEIRQYIALLEAPTPPTDPDLARDLPFIIRQLVPAGIDTVCNITAPALQEFTARQVEDLLFIAREALSNAVRHGHPAKIAVDLRQTEAATTLTVQDNGAGFDPAQVRSGLGTTTMQTRAARLGAELHVIGIPGMGATVQVSIAR
jgi:signal transduction histidine kinase